MLHFIRQAWKGKEEGEPCKGWLFTFGALQHGDHTATSLLVTEGCPVSCFYVPQFWQSFPQSWQSPKVTYIKKHPTKWNPFERFWTGSVWNKINISSHSQITKTVSIKRAVYVLIRSEDSVPEMAPFEVKGKAPAVFMMPRFLTELKNNMVIGFLSSE